MARRVVVRQSNRSLEGQERTRFDDVMVVEDKE
jgi:hypothetical protein